MATRTAFFLNLRHLNQRGSSIVIVLMAALALSIIGSVFYSRFYFLLKQQNRQNLLNTVVQTQNNVIEAINSEAAWAQTLTVNAAPTSMAAPFKLVDPSGGIVSDSTDAASGFTSGGKYCSTFSASGSANCPLHLQLTWRQVGSCNGVAVASLQFAAVYTFQPGTDIQYTPIKWANFNSALAFCRPLATQTFSCSSSPPATPCSAPDAWYCTSTGWGCGQIYK